MTASPVPASPVPASAWPDRPASTGRHGLWARLAAAGLHAVAGLLMGASALGIGVVASLADRGLVALSPADTALLGALVPAVLVVGALAIAHLAAAIGIVLGTHAGAAFGIAAGLGDIVMGAVMVGIALLVSRNRDDGLGIGLTIAKGLIEAQDGKLWAESDGLEQGSTFKVLLSTA